MDKQEIWRDFIPGETTVKSLVFEDAWYPRGVKEGRLVDPSVPGARAVHLISIEEARKGGIFEIATDGERWIWLDSVPIKEGSDEYKTVLASGDPPYVLTTDDRDRINRLIVYHLTKLIQYHLKAVQELPSVMAIHMTRYVVGDEAFYDCA